MKIGGDILYIYIIIAIIVILLIYVLIAYNSFINSRNLVKEAFSTMDVYLKKRWDIIPNLVEVVKGYSTHEQETLTKITSLRSSNYDDLTMNNKININEELSKCLANVFAVSENYPDLKANELFAKLSDNLISVEDEIANSRKYYNGTVRNFNNKIQMFPNNIIAKIFKFKEFKIFEANAEEKHNIGVNLNE